jgi:ferredoxin-nitrate reductase
VPRTLNQSGRTRANIVKGGAIKITKLPSTDGEVKIHAKEQQSAAEDKASKKAANPMDIGGVQPRRRGMERWIGEIEECEYMSSTEIERPISANLIPGSTVLLEIIDRILLKTESYSDMQNGLRIIREIAERFRDRVKPLAEKYEDDKDWGQRRARTLVDTLFFTEKDKIEGSYLLLETLNGLQTYLSYIRGGLRGMWPAAQALWDQDLCDCVQEGFKDVAKMEEWCLQQLQIQAPQSLVVPVPINGQM